MVEIWDRQEGLEECLQDQLGRATKALGIERETVVTITPLHNLFPPRLDELPDVARTLPGAPGSRR